MLPGEIVTYAVAGVFVGWLLWQLARDMLENRRVTRGPVVRHGCADAAWPEHKCQVIEFPGRRDGHGKDAA